MKKNYLKKILILAVICIGLNNMSIAQCNANYVYNIGSAGAVTFTNTSTGATGSTLYTWYFGDGTNSSVASPTHTFQYNGTYYVTLSMGDTSNINNVCDSASQIITITNGLTCNIAAGFSYSAGSNGQINFTNTSTNVPGGAVYEWGFGDSNYNISSQASPSHTYYYNGTYSVYMHVSDSLQHCSANTVQTVTVTNGNPCNLNVNYTYTVSSNGQVFFTNTTTGADTTVPLNWYFGDGGATFGQQNPSHVFAYNGTYYVSLNVGDSMAACHGSRIDTIVITNTSNAPICGAGFSSNADSLQSGGVINFTNTSWGTTSQTLYTWVFGDGTTSILANPPAHTYAYNGQYAVTLSITDSSTGCSSYYADTILISTTGPAPCIANVTFNMHQDSLNPQPGIWQVSTYYSPQISSAVWNWGDGTSTNGLSPTHTYTAAGHYNICVTAYTSCGDSAYVCQNDSLYRTNGTTSIISVTVLNVNNVTGIKNVSKEIEQVNVYPNPSSGLFMLNLSNVSSVSKAQINIINILGEVIYSTQEPVNNGTITKAIDLQNIANGAYFMKVVLGDKMYTNKLIKN